MSCLMLIFWFSKMCLVKKTFANQQCDIKMVILTLSVAGERWSEAAQDLHPGSSHDLWFWRHHFPVPLHWSGRWHCRPSRGSSPPSPLPDCLHLYLTKIDTYIHNSAMSKTWILQHIYGYCAFLQHDPSSHHHKCQNLMPRSFSSNDVLIKF